MTHERDALAPPSHRAEANRAALTAAPARRLYQVLTCSNSLLTRCRDGANEVRAGSLADLRAEGRLLTKVGTAPGRRVLARRHRVRDRGPLPAPRLPAAPGHGRSRPRHVSLAPRALRPRVGLHARPLGRRRARLRRRRARRRRVRVTRVHADPVGHLQTRLRNGLEDDISLVVAKSVLGLLDAGVPASEIVRTGVEFGTQYRARRVGARASPCSSRWPTSSPISTPTTTRSRSCTASRFVARDTSNHAPRFAVGALETQGLPTDRLGELVPPLRRDPLVGRRRTHARDRAGRAGRPRPTSRQ